MKKVRPFSSHSFLETFPYSYYSDKKREKNEKLDNDFINIQLSILKDSENLAKSIDPSIELFMQCERTLSDGEMKNIQFVGSDIVLTLASIAYIDYNDPVDIDITFNQAQLKCYDKNQKIKLPLNEEKQKKLVLSKFTEVHHIHFKKKDNQYYFHIHNGNDLIIQCSHMSFNPHQNYNHPLMKIIQEKEQIESSVALGNKIINMSKNKL